MAAEILSLLDRFSIEKTIGKDWSEERGRLQNDIFA